ncbi:uncharacterized protein N7496_006981 [Penicillium cataractarum]|uniref:F-box domain-containing protein n=1 Tax=Penicillium cataractarum TaxID=2100454 RepID=A0A9W9S4I8_9EURO|nr:uncharacterized protein N7496_006981 [Penicillium cataractarum]KAJ5370889.1 hypothetical protein N7496_006981 [Penicillium cataractarum]
MAPYLPFELIRMIVSYIFDVETLLALRLVNGIWRAAVDEFPDHRLYVDVLNRNLDRFDHVSQTQSLRERVRTLVWNLPDRPAVNLIPNSNQPTFDEGFLGGIQRMRTLTTVLRRFTLNNGAFLFPNLAHVAIHFRPPPIPQGRRFTCSALERLVHLGDVFECAFMGLNGLSGLDEMSILNIPVGFFLPLSIPGETVSQWLSLGRVSSLFRLKSLRLGFVGPETWPRSNGMCQDIRPVGGFDLLIYPVRHTLRHLSISNWGFYMKNPPRSIAGELLLPVLESLELRSCGFASDYTLSWILRHASTLRSLKLDDCAIIFSMELGPTGPAETETAHVVIDLKAGRVNQAYRLLWATWFQVIANGLPHLHQFEFGSSRVRAPGEIGPKFRSEISEGPTFGHTDQFLFGIFPDRYLEMKDGDGNTPWVLRRKSRSKCMARPAADEGDLAALRSLLERIGQVVRENDASSHAANVNNLIGSVDTNSEY